MKKYIILLLTAFTLFSCSQKTSANNPAGESKTTDGIAKIYALNDYQQDFNEMVETLLKKHPQPYAFISKDSLDELIKIQ
jgi:PBP1b-binding outer membrane lipoprotein LpoB